MKGYDAFAGVIKSGGKTRRAAKMVILNAEHPDIVEFINCKVEEEKKAWALIDAGYDGSFTGPAYASVFFQNSNNSVRVTDEFMRAVLDDGEWQTRAVTTGEVMDTYKARDLMRQIAEGTWVCGDPGMQFDTTVNDWHTCPNTARINASNPCSEYMFLDDSACNLASINLMKFVGDGRRVRLHRRSTRACAHDHHRAGDPGRQLELPDEGDRAEQPRLPAARPRLREPRRAADVARPAVRQRRGARLRGGDHRGDARRGLRAVGARRARSRRAVRRLREEPRAVPARHAQAPRGAQGHRPDAACRRTSSSARRRSWDECVELGEQHGYRNAQATVLAPTGTIGFMMDCDTTGVEPDIALVKYKKLVGGGLMKIVNNTVPMALAKLGYTPAQVKEIVDYIDENETIEGAPHLKDKHLPVFDCAFKPARGRPLDPLHGPHQDDGRRAAVHLRRDQQDGQRAEGRDGRGNRAGLHRVVEHRREGRVDLPRRQQAHAAAQHVEGQGRRRPGRREPRRRRTAPPTGCPTSGRRSRTSSTSPATRATSPSASTRTASRARSS